MRSYDQYCAVAKALDVVGDRWTLLVIRELLLQDGARYADLQRGLPGISTNLLGDRLKSLELHGIICRYDAPPPVSAMLYRLTELGRELESVVRSLVRFGARYMAAPMGTIAFQSHWLAFPIDELIDDADPSAPPVVVEIRMGGRPVFVAVAHGDINTTLIPPPASPDLLLTGDAQIVLGLLTGQLDVGLATQLGLAVDGDRKVLRRFHFNGPSVIDDPADLAKEIR